LSDEEDDKIVLVTTYNPNDNTVKDLVHKNWDLLGKRTNTAFLHEKRLMTAYRRPKNLRDILVSANCQIKGERKPVDKSPKQTLLDHFLGRSANVQVDIHASASTSDIGPNGPTAPRKSNSLGLIPKAIMSSNICTNKKCRYCPRISTASTIKCTVSGETFSTKFNVTCRSSNLIYCITCKTCSKQYVGQTKRKVSKRFQGHFYNIKSAQEFYQTKVDNAKTVKKREPKDAVGIHFPKGPKI
jgi:hypothetical protein